MAHILRGNSRLGLGAPIASSQGKAMLTPAAFKAARRSSCHDFFILNSLLNHPICSRTGSSHFAIIAQSILS